MAPPSTVNLINSDVRKQFPALSRRHPQTGQPGIYFDNACMTARSQAVIDAVSDYYAQRPACFGRSAHWWADEVAGGVRYARKTFARLIGLEADQFAAAVGTQATEVDQIVFTRNTTDALNRIASGLSLAMVLTPDHLVLTTTSEHNSNRLPWKTLSDAGRFRYEQLPMTADGTFDLDAFETKVKTTPELKVVSVALTSNLNGATVPIAAIVAICRKYRNDRDRILVVVDGAQAVPYQRVDVLALDIDFLAFSAHKMGGPALGVLYAKHLDLLEPTDIGGGAIDDDEIRFGDHRGHEAGLQAYENIIGAGRAAELLMDEVGLDAVKPHVRELNRVLTSELEALDAEGAIQIIPPHLASDRGSILTFRAPPAASAAVAEACAREQIMYRSGQFCVHSYFKSAAACRSASREWKAHRFSVYYYNTVNEAEMVGRTLRRAVEGARA